MAIEVESLYSSVLALSSNRKAMITLKTCTTSCSLSHRLPSAQSHFSGRPVRTCGCLSVCPNARRLGVVGSEFISLSRQTALPVVCCAFHIPSKMWRVALARMGRLAVPGAESGIRFASYESGKPRTGRKIALAFVISAAVAGGAVYGKECSVFDSRLNPFSGIKRYRMAEKQAEPVVEERKEVEPGKKKERVCLR